MVGPWRTAALLAIIVVSAANPVRAAGGSDSVFEVSVSPGTHLDLCVNDTERFFISVTRYEENWFGQRIGLGSVMPVGLVVALDGSALFMGRAAYTTVSHKFDQVGDFEIQVAVNAPAGFEQARVVGATIFVKVSECHYEVDTFSIWHLRDGGFNPVLGSTIDAAVVDRVTGTLRSYEGTGTATNVAVAFPRGGCKPSFDVEDVQATLSGFVTTDDREFRLHIEWKRGRTAVSGTGVACGPISAGTSDPFQVAPLDVRMPAPGVAAQHVQGVAHAMTTRGKTITGQTFVFVKRVRE